MKRIEAPRDLLIDRYHRGARVMVGAKSFVIAEEAAAILDAVKAAGPNYECQNDDERDVVSALLERGLLIIEGTS